MALIRIKIRSTRKNKTPKNKIKEAKKELMKVLRKIGKKGVENIKSEIKKRDLVDTGKMIHSVSYRMTKQGVRFLVDTEYATYLNEGVKKHQMVYLTKADKPIPISVANAIYRSATPKSMREGKWMHPGFTRGQKFLETAMKRTREYFKKEIKKTGKIIKF